MTELPVKYIGLPADYFPVRVMQFNEETMETVWSAEISGPGALRVPGGYDFPVGVIVFDRRGATIRLTNGEEYSVPADQVQALLREV